MATTQANIVITCNGKQAIAIIDTLKLSLKNMKKQYDALVQSGQAGTQTAKNLREQIVLTERALRDNQGNLERVKRVLSDLSNATLRQLKGALSDVKREFNNSTGDPKKLEEIKKKYKLINDEIQRRNGLVGMGTNGINQQSSAMKRHLQNLIAYMGLYAVLDTVVSKLTAVYRLNFKLSDQLADIRKVSGLFNEDINQLSRNLAKIDTRTTIEELNKIAYEGAKLGIPDKYGIEGLEQFTKAANQVNVALREELGDEALTALSKMVEVMGLIPKLGVEQSMLKTASAMFQLASSSTSSADQIVEFSKRLTGVARTAGITADQLLALGSASDSMGLTAEVSSTAFSQLLVALQQRHNLIEQAMGVSPGTINNLFQAGKMMDVIVLLLEKMRDKGNMNAMKSIFDSINLDGSRAVSVFATMAKNVDMLKDQLEVGKKAFEEGTAVTREYEIQQQTAQALMERAANTWEKASVNPDGVDMVKELAQAWFDLSRSVTSNSAYMGILKTLFEGMALAVRALIALFPALMEGLAFKGVVATVQAVGNAIGLMGKNAVIATIQTQGLTAAWKALNMAQKANVIGLVISLVGSLTIAIADLFSKTREATSYMDGFTMSLKGVDSQFASAQYEALRYKKSIEQAAEGSKARNIAIKNFQDKFGQYYKSLGLEITRAKDLATAYQKVCQALRGKLLLEAENDDREKYVKPAVGWTQDRLYEYNQSVKSTNLSQYNGDWLEARVSDLMGKGLGSRKTIVGQLAKDFGVDKSNQSGWAIGTALVSDAQSKTRRKLTAKLEASGDDMEARFAALFRAADYVSQRISLKNRDRKVTQKYGSKEAKESKEAYLESLNTVDASLGELSNNAVPKGDKSALAAHNKELRDQLKEAQERGKAVIDNVKNYYERQLTKITETANAQDWDKALTDAATNYIQVRMNTALAQVRFAIKGTKNEWEKFKTTMSKDMIEQADETGFNRSDEILGEIMAVDVNKTRETIMRLTDSLGMPFNSALNAVAKNGSLDEKANTTIAMTQRNERNKRLLDNNYTGKTDNEYRNSMETLGFYGLTDTQTSNAMAAQTVKNMNPNDKDYAAVSAQAKQWEEESKQRAAAIDTAFQNVREHIAELYSIGNEIGTDSGNNRLLSILFGEDWQNTAQNLLPVLSMTGDDIKVFYDEMLKYYDAYTTAEKKRDDERKKVIDYRWKNSAQYKGFTDRQEQLDMQKSGVSQYSVQTQQQKEEGMDVPRNDVYGTDAFISSFGNDPEVEAYRLKMAAAQAYYDYLKANNATTSQLAAAERSILAAESEYAKATAEQTKQRMDDLYALMSPIEDFGTSIGEAFATMTEDAEAGRKAMKTAIGDMINAFMKQTVTMTQEYIKRRIMQQSNDYITSRQMKASSDEQIQIEEDTQSGLRRAVRTGNDGKKQILTNWSKESLGVIQEEAKKEISAEEDKQDDVNKTTQKGGKKKQSIFKKISSGILGLFKKDKKNEVKQEESKQEAVAQVQEQGGEARQTVAETTEEGIGDITAQVGQETLQTQAAQAQASVQTESAETQAKIPMGIAAGASKIIGSLGWWGIPLVAVITALLNGLLSFAMSKVSSLFGGGGSSDDSGTTTKLVSGMLTYDKGNVQAFSGVETGKTYPVVGNDGKVYAAKDAGELSTGLVKDPITTIVNGQPALVAERGPEMVIGRETTAAMMMNRPDLLREIVRFDRTRSGMQYRAYDAGNVAEFANTLDNSPLTPTDAQQLRDTIKSLSLVLASLQANGIQAHINKYGRGGVVESAASGANFMRRNSGDRLWRKI